MSNDHYYGSKTQEILVNEKNRLDKLINFYSKKLSDITASKNFDQLLENQRVHQDKLKETIIEKSLPLESNINKKLSKIWADYFFLR